MDAYSTGRASLIYSDKAPILIAASSDAAIALARRTAEAAGLRIAKPVRSM